MCDWLVGRGKALSIVPVALIVPVGVRLAVEERISLVVPVALVTPVKVRLAVEKLHI